MAVSTLTPLVLPAFEVCGEEAMVAFGRKLAGKLRDGGVVFLKGTLGVGKTTLCRGILQGLGHQGAVKSPTYTLVEPYELPGIRVFHFDLYRLGDPEELEYMGVRDYFDGANLCLLEWPERGRGYLPHPDLEIGIRMAKNGRTLVLCALSDKGQQYLQDFTVEV